MTPIGTCSLCGGPVIQPNTWAGLDDPTPHCARCGARKKVDFGPVIEMEERRPPAQLWPYTIDFTPRPVSTLPERPYFDTNLPLRKPYPSF